MQEGGNNGLEKSASPRSEVGGGGRVECAAWLTDDMLLVKGRFLRALTGTLEACLINGNAVLPLEARALSQTRSVGAHTDVDAGEFLTLRFLSPVDARSTLGRLLLKTGDETFSPQPSELSEALTELPRLLERCFDRLTAQAKSDVLRFLSSTLCEHLGTTNAQRLSHNLHAVRDYLREPHPASQVTPEQPRGLYVERLLAINETSFYIRGWVYDASAKITHLSIVLPEGQSVEIAARAYYFRRPDVQEFFKAQTGISTDAKSGFLCYFETESPTLLPTGWLAEARNAAGDAIETTIPPLIRDPDVIKNMLLGDIAEQGEAAGAELLSAHMYPALSQIQQQRLASIESEPPQHYGDLQAAPVVSIIIPLYKRIDFMEHQLAQFAHDAEVCRAELIYVLDSPELAEPFSKLSSGLFNLYRIPFRTVVLKQNYGYSTANNVGAKLARGRLLLLLNSDVLPDNPGWLGKMVDFYDSMPGVGALGPKLLFEDDTLQHAGMYFERQEHSGLWTNEHYFRGYERHLPAANKPRPVPAVTGACMLVSSDLYRQLGGLHGMYVQGDYEDSDFCLRLIEAGYKNWYLPYAELYHLEGQSYPPPLRQSTWKYNAWVHTSLWGSLIEQVMSVYPSRFGEAGKYEAEAPRVGIDGAASLSNDDGGERRLPPSPAPKLVRVGNAEALSLYLQNCARDGDTSVRVRPLVWMMDDAGALASRRSE